MATLKLDNVNFVGIAADEKITAHDRSATAHGMLQRRLGIAAIGGFAGAASVGKKCFVWQDHYATAGTTWVLVPIGGDYFATYVFATPSAHPVRTLLYMGVCLPFLQLSAGDESVTLSGSWPNGTIANGIRGDTYWHASTSASYAEFTFTGSAAGMWQFMTTNGGYAIVSVDGSSTAANKLPVVTQSLVDSGDFIQDDLGKRYITSYSSSPRYDQWCDIVDGLTEGSHTIRVTPTGTKPSAASAARCYISMFGLYSIATSMATTNVAPAPVEKVIWPAVIHAKTEISAIVPVLSTSTGGFTGEVHGRETEIAFAMYLDGVESTPDADSVTPCDEILIRRTSALDDGAIKVVEFVVDKSMPGRMAINVSYFWGASKRVNVDYCGMLPCVQYKGNGTPENKFDIGWSDGGRFTFVSDGINKGGGNSGLMALASTTSPFVAWLSTSRSASSFYSASDATFANDRPDKIRKWYSSKASYSVAPGAVQILQSVIGINYMPGFTSSDE